MSVPTDLFNAGCLKVVEKGKIVSDEFGGVCSLDIFTHENVYGLVRFTSPLTLFFHLRFEGITVHREASFTGHQFGGIERETIGVVQLEGKFPGESDFIAQTFCFPREKLDAPVQSLVE